MTTIQVNLKKTRIIRIAPVCDNLTTILEPYVHSEIIPPSDISDVIQKIFPSCEIVSEQYINSSTAVSITIKITILKLLLLANNICAWKYNRPVDEARCNDIARNIFSSKYIMDTMLYFNFNKNIKYFEIIDGIHRYHSWKMIQNYNNTPTDFENNTNWFNNSNVFINIRVNESHDNIIKLFKNINNTNPISELYLRNRDNDKTELIQRILDDYKIKYKQHFSSSNKPNKPNTNNDQFTNLLSGIYDKHKLTHETAESLIRKLEELNTYVKNIVIDNEIIYTEQTKYKCINTGMWLFNFSVEELIVIS